MSWRQFLHFILGCSVLLAATVFVLTGPVAAQAQPGQIQKITGRLRAGDSHAYLLANLQAGDRLTAAMRTTSGNLDPALGIVSTATPLEQVVTGYQADIQNLLATSENVALALEDLRNRYFLVWDDDSGSGYAAALEFVVTEPGDYVLLTAGSLSAFGRATAGDYELLLGLNTAEPPDSQAVPTGAPIAQRIQTTSGTTPAIQEITGTLSADTPWVNLRLVDIPAGQPLYAYVETVSGSLRPALILRDFGGKAVEAGNLGGQEPRATLVYSTTEEGVGFSLRVQAATLPDGTTSAGGYRALVGINAPEVLTGQAASHGEPVLDAAIPVQVGLKIERISQVDSQDENYTVLASLRMDWTDPRLAFSPDSCNCAVKLYSEKEFGRFLSDVQSLWPGFAFFNQLGNRWIKSQTAAIWPDGRARYAESFSTTFQADFDFRQYPFDTQEFPIFLDLLYPANVYTLTDLPGYSAIDPAHGEDEFIVGEFTTATSTIIPVAADEPVSRMTFSFSAPRHLNYYVLQVFLPILLIILISWFTFFLRDYTRRIEAAAANILLFIAFSFSLADNYPRLGYITFLDAVMGVTFAVNVLVLLYNVYMKRLENQGQTQRVERIDNLLDWVYPLAYLGLIGVVVLLFL